MVSFPRISITLKGCDVTELSGPGESVDTRVRKGEAMVVPPNCWNRPSRVTAATVLTILLGKKQLGLSLTTCGRGEVVMAPGSKRGLPAAITEVERQLVQALLESVERGGAAAPAIIDALLVSLLEVLKTTPFHHTRRPAARHDGIVLYVQQNFAFPLSRESVAAHFHLSAGHVSRLFRREGLVGFNEYLNRVRVDRAKFLLRRHPLTLDEIAAKCGYRDTAYFCRVFKRMTKMTPSAYRAQAAR